MIEMPLAPNLGAPDVVAENTDVMSTAGVIASAHALYCHKRFADAANTIRTAGTDDPRLAPLADTFPSVAPGGPITERFNALVIARRDDLVLGGAFADELSRALADLCPKAAIGFMAQKDYDHAQLALAIGESLGIDDANIRAVRHALEHRHLELK